MDAHIIPPQQSFAHKLTYKTAYADVKKPPYVEKKQGVIIEFS